MTWLVIALLAAGVALQRLAGMFVGTALIARFPAFERLASLIPAAVVSAVIVQLTFTSKSSLVIDERLAGVAVAGFLVWRRAPMVVTIVAAAAVTAFIRAAFAL
ncbi:MAG: AzlD domain-containing protein [Ilumatobacteraceae bacterium]